jgi:hypothetical protein
MFEKYVYTFSAHTITTPYIFFEVGGGGFWVAKDGKLCSRVSEKMF